MSLHRIILTLDPYPADAQYGFYFVPAADPKLASRFTISFMGGGWCYDENTCFHRSGGRLGMSNCNCMYFTPNGMYIQLQLF